MMKKLFSILLVMAMLVTIVPAGAVSVSAASVNDLTYTINNGEVTITDCNTWASGTLVIPDKIEGYPVTSIGEDAFYDCRSLTMVTIPASVTSIGDSAFNSCSSLTSVTIPDGVTTIGDYVFCHCSGLTSVTIPDGVTTIGKSAFSWCKSLKAVTIPSSVTTIGTTAFYWCKSLKAVTIPSSVITIGASAFSCCYDLTSIAVDDDNAHYSSENGVLFNKDKSVLVQYPYGKEGAYSILDSVTTIGDYAFSWCINLTSVTIPDSVTTIGSAAFQDCESLTSVVIPDSVTAIGDYAFFWCINLTSVTIPKSVTTIDKGAFSSCDSLTDVYYMGNKADRAKIEVGSDNTFLLNATMYYNACVGKATHSYISATCIVPMTCMDCGVTSGSELGHDYDNACDQACNRCDTTRATTHDYKSATCTEPKTCIECGATSGSELGHDYDNACDQACNRCGDTRTTTHNYKLATCTEPKTCIECGATSGSELGHDYDNTCDEVCNRCDAARAATHKYKLATCTEPKTCIVCGAISGSELGHKYDNDCDATCSRCDAIRTVVHAYKAATCTQAKTCMDCGATSGSMLGHDYDNVCDQVCNRCDTFRIAPHDYKPATCIEPKMCVICGYAKGETIDHILVNDVCTMCGFWQCSDCAGVGSVSTTISCTACAGKGSTSATCTNCSGNGNTGYQDRQIDCGSCGGDGFQSLLKQKTCNGCSGAGKWRYCGICGTQLNSFQTKCYWCSYGVTNTKYCSTCNGKGTVYDFDDEVCSSCHGAGEVFAKVPITCGYCGGKGKVTNDCASCDGGSVPATEECFGCGGAGGKSLVSISLSAMPKLSYLEGEPFDKGAMQVVACYDDGTECGVTNYTVSGYSSTLGKKTITISYRYQTVTLTAYVTANCQVYGHRYTNECDKVCNACGAIRTIPGHTYKKVVVTKATTTKDGKYKNVCEKCGYVASAQPTIYKASKVSLSKTSYTYNAKVQKPSVIVKDSKGNTISSTHYTVKYVSGLKAAGTYKVTITFKGNYSGTKTLSYTIKPVDVSKCKITLSSTSYTYTGGVKKPTVTVKTAAGTKLTTTSYTVTYASGCKNVGEYKVTVKMKGNYSGTKTVTFKIIPAKASISKLTGATKSLKVTWSKKTPQVTGYEIQYSTSKTFKTYKTKTVSSYKTTSTSLTGLKAKTTYYVRVRTYKTVGSKKVYSGWSTIKSLKTK